ncbi:Ti-type conjugative transfer relaxase TraA [Methylocystis sp. IM2]|uniref:Ti-type conjugative transfer relaxase TraA n=1 Tax=Methylocystis sp. IM2 TaxID=3136563 RepID=UPI0030F68733
MAIYHLSMKPISRASGRSSVAAAAYRAGECLTNERDGLAHDFTRREGVDHAEIVLPQGAGAEWALDRSALWNAAEQVENRKDARVAREFEIALPHELSAEQRLALTRSFAQDLADRYGTAVDFAIHAPHGATDVRNHHAHLLMTTRRVTAEGLAEKSFIERENKWLAANDLPSAQLQLREVRQAWEQVANAHLARAGLDIRIDHRSHQERGLEIEPTEHMGVHATQMERRGKAVGRGRLDAEAARRNAELIREKPEQVLSIISNEKSVFDRRDVARALHRYVDGAEAFQSAFAKVMASPALVELQPEQRDGRGNVAEPARYSTREMVEIERGMAGSADALAEARGCGVSERHVAASLSARPFLSEEQREAVRHVTGDAQIAAVVGLAGAGKSTMLSAAREAWEAQGYHVHGAALAGKAAEGLEESSGIASRTLASWEHGWQNGRGELAKGDVLVIDEAGMVSSRQLARFVGEAERTGAKIVLVGDPEQLQPIQAGAAFRAIAERVGFVELEGVRRQGEDWQRAASVAFARHRTEEGLSAYAERGAVRLAETREAARAGIVRDVIADMDERPGGSRIVLAHLRADVRKLNEAIRAARQERGELIGERAYSTNDGERKFAAGDRILFLENNRDLAVKNGMLGTVERAEEGRLSVRLDSAKGEGRDVSVSMADYAAVDYGYATTIHKAQGATVDRAYVLASETMDRHLAYVAMTRHRESATLYAGKEEFRELGALSARLSRARAKETTLDYPRDYAERRGVAPRSEIVLPQRERSDAHSRETAPAREAAREAPVPKKRSVFAGLQLRAGRSRASTDAKDPGREADTRPAMEPRQEPRPGAFSRAVEDYARAYWDAARMRAENLPVLEHQKQALGKAGAALDAAREGSTRELLSALRHDPATRAAMPLEGPERAARLIAGIERERQAQRDPNVRAERAVAEWRKLEKEHGGLRGFEQDAARGQVEERMKTLAGAIKRDPQMESILRARSRELGIELGSRLEKVIEEKNLEQALARSVERERDRGWSGRSRQGGRAAR